MTYPGNEILLLNPRRKGRKKAAKSRKGKRATTTKKRRSTKRNPSTRRAVVRRTAKGVYTMAKKRTHRKRRAPRRNPSPRRRAVVRRVKASFAGLNFKQAFKNVPLGVIGMFAAKWAAKRGTPDALESDPATWNGMTYLKGGLGAVGAGWIANMIRPGSGQKVLEGGLLLLAYKAAQNHVVPKNTFLTNQFGFGAETPTYMPGDVETNSAGEPFILGQDGQTWVPLAEGEDQSWEMMGSNLEPEGRLGFGDVLEPAGRMGFGQPATVNAYAKHLFNT